MSQHVFANFLGAALVLSVLSAVASQPSGRLVEVESGETSASTVLTNGATFKMDGKTYRLEVEPVALVEEESLLKTLKKKGAPIRVQKLPAKDAFTMLSNFSGATMVCGRNVDQELPVNINTQDDSVWDVLEQVCFQIDAEFTVRNGTVWITNKK